ncbi:MAG: glycosyltransferase [Anaerolineales bacterium]
MRILYLTHQYFPRHVGGTEVYTHALAQRARRAGHEAAVVTYHESASANPRRFGPYGRWHDGIRVWELHYNLQVSPEPARYEFHNPVIAGWIADLLDDLRPDLVHATHLMKLSGAAIEPCLARGIPVMVTLTDFWAICPRHTLLRWNEVVCDGPGHRLDCVRCVHATHGFASTAPLHLSDIELIPGLYRSLRASSPDNRLGGELRAMADRNPYLRTLLGKVRARIALSGFQKKFYVANGFPEDSIQVIPHGPAEEDVVRTGHRPGRLPRVVFIGALVPQKGAHILLEALARAPELSIECRIYGPMKPRTEYRDRLRSLGSNDRRVRLTGEFQPRDLSRILSEADIVVIPSTWHENAPFIAKAARRLGIPVLASRVGSLEESLPSPPAKFFRAGDAHDLQAGLVAILDESAWLHRVPDLTTPTLEEHAQKIFEIYARETGQPW